MLVKQKPSQLAALLTFFSYFVAMSFVVGFFYVLSQPSIQIVDALTAKFLGVGFNALAFSLFLYIYFDFSVERGVKKGKASDLKVFLGAIVMMLLFLIVWDYGKKYLGISDELQALAKEIRDVKGLVKLPILLTTGLLVPVVEELIFRGLWHRSLSEKVSRYSIYLLSVFIVVLNFVLYYQTLGFFDFLLLYPAVLVLIFALLGGYNLFFCQGGFKSFLIEQNHLPKWLTYLLSSSLFALVHGEIDFMIPLAVIGGLCAWVYDRTGSWKLAALLHGINNTSSLVILWLMN